jgi:acyl-homoserine lactone acylase PvdQ
LFTIEVLYNGTWHHFESENVEIAAYRVARDVRRNLKLSARVTCAGVVLAERTL